MRDPYTEVVEEIRNFDREREWAQFHSPRNLVLAVLVEAGELAAHFQWSEDTAIDDRLNRPETRQGVSDEMADVLIHLLQLADRLDIDLLEAARLKLRSNALKYPVSKSFGNAEKRNLDPPAAT